MKPSKLLRWVVFGSVGALACGGGVSSIGKGGGGGDAGEGGTTSGSGASASKGGSSSGPSGKGGSLATAGRPGTGASPGVELCDRDSDCTPYDLPCQVCADGSQACSEMVCLGGKCAPSTPVCDAECQNDMDCPVPDIACAMCEDGTSTCPKSTCAGGACKTTFPTCGGNYCAGLPCGSMCPCLSSKCDPSLPGFCDRNETCQSGVPECSSGEMCGSALDCGTPPPICVPCAGGSCAGLDCIKGQCTFACPAVDPSPICKTSEDCPAIEECKQPCASTDKCPVNACLQNTCTPVCPL